LDRIEAAYERLPATAVDYDGNEIKCSVYSQNAEFFKSPDRANDKPPMERYLDLMAEGAKHFGIKQEYIDWILNHEKQPRKKPEEFDKYEVPEGLPTWTIE